VPESMIVPEPGEKKAKHEHTKHNETNNYADPTISVDFFTH